MIRQACGALFAVLLALQVAGQDEPKILLAGDSTMADKAPAAEPERGWGQVFSSFLREGIVVENHARNGKSTRSFLREGRWDSLCSHIQPGDYVLIQFGHNDAKQSDTNRFAPAQTEYRENLARFVRDVRERKGIPVLLTPIARRKFGEKGELVDTHGEYPVVMREVAEAEDVPLIDMQKRSSEWLRALGPEGSKEYFLWVPPGVYPAHPGGKQDDTHFVDSGARAVAGLVVQGIRELGLPLADLLRDESAQEADPDEVNKK